MSNHDAQRLRGTGLERPFHVVLVEPEIPPNTGNIVRLCAATQSPLHLVGRLGFSIDEHAVRRAGVDTWPLATVHTHADFAVAQLSLAQGGTERLWLFSGRAERSYLDVEFRPGDALVFGKESTGLGPEVLERFADRVVGIPTLGPVRSLNLANSVAIALFEALRQVGALHGAVKQ